MTRQLYLECAGGIAGDMAVGALLDLGADEAKLRKALASLPLDGYKIDISRVTKAGLDACDFDVVLDEDNHDHDMAYLYGNPSDALRAPAPLSGEPHTSASPERGGGPQSGGGVIHHHTHRHLKEIREIFENSALTDGAKAMALKIFEILAEAEGKAHGVSPEAVHFHEVGAVDAIVDIAAAAICLDDLGITAAYVSPLAEGQGTVRCQHGVLPVPVPAVANIAAAHGLRLSITNRRGEWVTPTGAAIAAAVGNGKNLPDTFTIDKIGLGAGKRDYPGGANVLRAMMIQAEEPEAQTDHIVRLETNIDDATGETLGHVMGKLFDAGARDAFFVPIYMKKNRPAAELVVITDDAHQAALEKIIFAETTTIGIRRVAMARTVLPREEAEIGTPFGRVRVKRVTTEDMVRLYPEYDAVIALCETTGRPYPEVLAAVTAACADSLKP